MSRLLRRLGLRRRLRDAFEHEAKTDMRLVLSEAERRIRLLEAEAMVWRRDDRD